VTFDSALKFPVSNLNVKWHGLSEFMVSSCHWYLGVTGLSVCHASAIWCLSCKMYRCRLTRTDLTLPMLAQEEDRPLCTVSCD
jgi:hypothetical protein